jgi:hypothetical protein
MTDEGCRFSNNVLRRECNVQTSPRHAHIASDPAGELRQASLHLYIVPNHDQIVTKRGLQTEERSLRNDTGIHKYRLSALLHKYGLYCYLLFLIGSFVRNHK